MFTAMKRFTGKFLVVAVILFISSGTFGQKIWVNAQLGAANYQGDLQDKQYTFDQAHAFGSLGLLYDLTDQFSVRALVGVGKLSADDKYGRNKDRNLNFTSNLTEAQLGLQYYIYPLAHRSLTPYVFGGLAMYRFNPYTTDSSGSRFFLRPLSTEGQGFVAGKDYYNLTGLAIPFGGGVKLSLTENINVGLEIGLRKLFTDYLDDVSGSYVDEAELIENRGTKAAELAWRGDEVKNGRPYPVAGTIRGGTKKDWYYSTVLTLSFRIPSGDGSGRAFGGRRSQFGCPVNVR